eukprot:jgi/Orpsp1_1/1190048/evm.model.d7180000076318.1
MLYELNMIKNILNSYIEIISNIHSLENTTIKDIEYIPINEKERIINEFNSDINKEECNKFYYEEFSEIAEKYPERCAIVFNEIRITYKELNEMSNSLAHYLRSQGVKRNDITPIICDRSPYYIIGILGISKAGGAFLPIDKNLPIERIKFILEDVKPDIILYKNCNDIIENLSHDDSINCNIYNLEKHNYSNNCNKINYVNNQNDVCYVLFTSGTTGNPKGTLISHFNICNYIRKFDDKYQNNYYLYKLLNDDKIKNALAITNFSFDMSQNEIMFTLYHGMNIILVDDIIYNDVLLLSNYIKINNADFIKITPTRLKVFLENNEFKKVLKNIKCIILGGEDISSELCININMYSNCTIYNEYGPTECSVACTTKKIDISMLNPISIGKPFCNCKIYILDKYEKPVPIGVEGEIYIGGYGVGKGYLNRPELTKEKFVENPFNFDNDEHNRIMYRTGDLGRWNSDGEIEYLGRIDFQVKINGQRVELGEIESKILEIPEIQQCVVIDKKKENGEKYLVCYYILKDEEEEILNKNIRNYLTEKLPRYMVPNYYIEIKEIPLSNTGKLNRRALPEPSKEDFISEMYESPETSIEKLICEIYSDIFDIDLNEIGRNHDFYELGGDSLNAIRILSRIEKELNIKIYVKDIMSHPIIYDLSKYIEYIIDNNNNDNYTMEIIERRHCKEFPVTSQQLGVYIDSIKQPNSIIYNIPKIYRLNRNVDKEKVKDSLLKIFSKQEILRTKYYGKEVNGKTEIYGYIDEECSLEFEEYSYEDVGRFIRPFELDEAPLMRVGFINDEVLLIDMHHIICDGITDLILMNELNQYYYDEEVEELDIQYSDYAIHLNEKKNNGKLNDQIEIYKEIFSHEYEILNIPRKSRELNKEINGKEENSDIEFNEINRFEQMIDKSTTEKINEYIKYHNISKTALFISIYGYVLSKYSGQDSIYTSVINMNRNNHYTENMAGMFVSTLPLLLKYENEENKFIEIIKENMEILNMVYKNQDISFAELIDCLKLKKVNNSFIFQPHISNKNNGKQNKSIFNINDDTINEIENILKQNNNSKFDIAFSVVENENDYLISIEYNSMLYESNTIKNIINSYNEIIYKISEFKYKNINNIEYISMNENEKIIKEFNSDENKKDCNKFYHEEFSKIAEMYPERCSIIFNEIKITYKELDEMSNSLAHYLRSQGVQRNDIIPIICDRSPFYIIGILGISKAGGAFLPIDKNLPYERIKFILEDVKPSVILYKNCIDIIELLNKEENIEYDIYDLEEHNYSNNHEKLNNINKINDTCYVLFTSGTTGNPKGALISHFNLYNNVRGFYNEYNEINENTCLANYILKENIKNLLAITNYIFDISHNEITLSLVNGFTIVLADEYKISNINSLSDYILKNNVEFINTTPSRFKMLLENKKFRHSLMHIKCIDLLGEELNINLCKEIHRYSKCKILNGYGPTEAAITCSYKCIKDDIKNKITIGKSQCNCKIYILDKYKKPVAIGAEGEIYIGGYGVGKGYLNRPELTKEKFIENPFNFDNDEHNRIMYRTGDLGRWTSKGEIEYLGRIDFQVKINGQRIELGEIESKVLEMSGIQQCVVIDKKKENGEKYIVCYYILKDEEEEILNKNIRNYLMEKLPRYMVPNYYIRINEIPLSNTGKLNRRGLPEPSKEDLITEVYVAPETTIEKTICEIYSDLFNIELKEIGRNHDFYELGGDSLNAI